MRGDEKIDFNIVAACSVRAATYADNDKPSVFAQPTRRVHHAATDDC
jgi:hypothetical protein